MDFEQFVRQRVPPLVRFASALCADHGLAEEIVQEVVMRMHGRWDTVRQVGALDAYVRRAVVNEYLSWRRKWARVIPHEVVPERRAVVPDPANQHAERSALTQQLAGLPPRQRAVLVLRYFEGLSDDEIAEVLGCRAVTVRGYASRALSALRIETAERRRIDLEERK